MGPNGKGSMDSKREPETFLKKAAIIKCISYKVPRPRLLEPFALFQAHAIRVLGPVSKFRVNNVGLGLCLICQPTSTSPQRGRFSGSVTYFPTFKLIDCRNYRCISHAVVVNCADQLHRGSIFASHPATPG